MIEPSCGCPSAVFEQQRKNRNFDIGRREKAQATKRVRIGGLIRTTPADNNDRAEGMIRKH
jgi:hypothetical protein